MAKNSNFVVAIDGPAGSGKSTVARLVAEKLGFLHLNTGSMYRAVTWQALQENVNLEDEDALVELAEQCNISFKNNGSRVILNGLDVSQQIRDEWAIFWRFYKTVRGLKENFFYAPGTADGFTADAFWIGAKDARKIVANSSEAYKKLVNLCLNRKLEKPYWVPGCPP